MYNLKRFYNINRKEIWLIVIIIAFLFIILKLINYFVRTSSKEEIEAAKKIAESNMTNTILNNSESITALGEKKSAVNEKEETEIINRFIEFCKEKNIEEAYNMITKECKEEMYSTKEKFQENYINKIFIEESVEYSVQAWIENTYKVDFIIGDILSTGNINTSKTVQDYITIENTVDGKLLNINSYIGRNKINSENIKDNIKIEVLESNTYKDYIYYNVKVENNSEKDILLDTRKDIKSMYLLDRKNVKYSAYTHELTEADLTVNRDSSREIRIKYYSSYISDKVMDRLVFSGIIMDYNTTTKMINSTEVTKIEVNI